MKSIRGDVSSQPIRRLFAIYAIVSLVPVLVLGIVLLKLLAAQSDTQGLAEGRADASLIARSAIAPSLDGRDLQGGLSTGEKAALQRNVDLVVRDGQVLRLRLRSLNGDVVYSSDSSSDGPDDESLDAAHGETVADLTYLNDDDADGGPRGARVVEVYEPLDAAQTGTRIGVLELYLPYAPIAAVIAKGLRTGLLGLWLCLLAVSVSVTGRLRREARINAHLANNDVLTGLPNRGRFTQLVDELVPTATAQQQVAVAVFDLDRFRQINETLGHDLGDQLLAILAARLKAELRGSDVVARLGGDEFGVVLADLIDPEDVGDILSRLRRVVAAPLVIDGLPLALEASVGYALAPRDGTVAGQLLQRADVAMYVAKQQHAGAVRYAPEQELSDAATLRLIAELGSAIDDNQLTLEFQPLIDLHTDQITSIEALVRWNHPTRGLLYPDSFIAAVEQTELIEPLTWWVLRNATFALRRLDPGGSLRVAVNISARSLTRPDFADDLCAVLAGTGTHPNRVVLEVTETVLLADPPRAAHTLGRLHDAGFEIAIDDFGAGQTSLGYLAMLPISELKIDKSFVLPMLTSEPSAAIVRSVAELGHSLGLSVTAEGVESPAVLDLLRAYECDTVQGYLISPPLAEPALAQFLVRRRGTRTSARRR
jgi:diguanylate cyclase (GGDEF)-like protein